jgi:nucleotide-binding universal stress UspA family protein
LIVPAASAQRTETARYTRVLVPLDGSVWSETVLSLATRLARTHGAELVLAHAVPRPELTRAGPAPPSALDLELERRLVERNEGIGREYLEHLRARLASAGINARTVLEHDGGVRADLLRAVARERPDIIALSTCGSSGHAERAAGTVAMHLLTHVTSPLLLVRPTRDDAHDGPRARRHAALALRLPTQATP